MIVPGTVRGIKELKAGLTAQVSLGSDNVAGYAVDTVTPKGRAVAEALLALKVAIAAETEETLSAVLEGQKKWDAEMANR